MTKGSGSSIRHAVVACKSGYMVPKRVIDWPDGRFIACPPVRFGFAARCTLAIGSHFVLTVAGLEFAARLLADRASWGDLRGGRPAIAFAVQ